MSQRLKKEMSQILLCPRPILVKVVSEAFACKAVKVVHETQHEMLRRRLDEVTVAIFEYLLDRQKNDGMFDQLDLD